jgi:hypothetical protein
VETFEGSWNCAKCGKVSNYQLSKREAAFFDALAPEKSITCPDCGNDQRSGGSHPIPDIDLDLLIEWASNPELCFLSQDQDLILADLPTSLLCEFYSSDNTVEQQRGWLLSAIMVKLYDENFKDLEERGATIRFLQAHQSDWSKYYIMPYIVDGIILKIVAKA